MRESIGGTVLLTIVMTFIVVYVSFLAIAINYSISFRVKNNVVSLIEEYESFSAAEKSIQDYLNGISYYQGGGNFTLKSAEGCKVINNIVSVCEHSVSGKSDALKNKAKYYTVKTYVVLDFPIFNGAFQIPISSDTKLIYDF